MQLTIYNTMTRQKETFKPLNPPKVGIYTCGPTVYRDPHIGNMRAFHYADLLKNILKYMFDYEVTHVINLTDVGHLTDDADQGDDKMEKGAKRDNLTVWELADRYIHKFQQAINDMRIDDFDIMPRATDHIQEQIDMVKVLEKKGYTYTIPGDGIYMNTNNVDEYGKLAGVDHIEGLEAGARVQQGNKKYPTDFALRKFSPSGEQRQMERESPWGKGFPGWHLECSAMASTYLGHRFDIHTGGVDHIGVHHTNEIAQSECCFDECDAHHPWVNYRMHNQFLQLGGKKMAKSEGGLITLEGIQQQGFSALDVKYLFLTGHYRNFLDFTPTTLQQAQTTRTNLQRKIQRLQEQTTFFPAQQDNKKDAKRCYETYPNIFGPLLDDLDTVTMLAELFEMVKQDRPPQDQQDFLSALYFLETKLLKIGLFDTEECAQTPIPSSIIALAQQRADAKKNKNYQKADKLREDINQAGFTIKDLPNNTWEITKKDA